MESSPRTLSQRAIPITPRQAREATLRTSSMKKATKLMFIKQRPPTIIAAPSLADPRARTPKMERPVRARTEKTARERIPIRKERAVQDQLLRMERLVRTNLEEDLKVRAITKTATKMEREAQARTARHLKVRAITKTIMTASEAQARAHTTKRKTTNLVTKITKRSQGQRVKLMMQAKKRDRHPITGKALKAKQATTKPLKKATRKSLMGSSDIHLTTKCFKRLS